MENGILRMSCYLVALNSYTLTASKFRRKKKKREKANSKTRFESLLFPVNLELSARINMHLSYAPLAADMHPPQEGSDYC